MSAPAISNATETPGRQPLVEVRDLTVRYPSRRAWPAVGARTLTALQGLSLSLHSGRVFGLAGESGSGKSTLARTILGLCKPHSGKVLLEGRDFAAMDAVALREARRRIQIVFQDPAATLSPRRRIQQTLLEPLDHFGIGAPAQRRDLAIQALSEVGLDESALPRFPHQFSSGQRQRIAIARALLPRPDLLIADEALSALDVSVQAHILELLRHVRTKRKIGMLLISHDLAVIRQLADRVGVMFRGRLVECAPAGDLFQVPRHPYIRQLLAAVPHPEPGQPLEAPTQAAGLASVADSRGCAFASRCPEAMPVCRERAPPMCGDSAQPGHRVECHLLAIHNDRPDEHE